MRLEEFKSSKAGALIGRLLSDGALVAEMLREPHRRPPVQALQRHLRAAQLQLSDAERQHVGRWTAEVLGRYGLRPIRGRSGTRRAPVREPGPLTSGALYQRSGALTTAEKWAKAREILLRDGQQLGTVDDFLAARRREWRED